MDSRKVLAQPYERNILKICGGVKGKVKFYAMPYGRPSLARPLVLLE
jgi:hypothetical protein